MAQPAQPSAGKGCLVIVGLAAFLAFGLSMIGKISKPSPSATDHDATLSAARPACAEAIRRQARYGARFTTWGAMSPSHARADGVRTVFMGEDLELQNGFGAWRKARYTCTFDRSTGSASAVVAER
jgi:hypothetical protein